MEEALRLGRLVGDAKDEVAKLGVETVKYLADRDTPDRNPQVRSIIRRVREKNGQIIARGGSLANDYGDLLQAYRRESDFYITRWEQVLARNSRVDAEKIANEELLDLLTRARQTMEGTPEAIETLVASAGIAHYSQFLSYADLLNAFLQYPEQSPPRSIPYSPWLNQGLTRRSRSCGRLLNSMIVWPISAISSPTSWDTRISLKNAYVLPMRH